MKKRFILIILSCVLFLTSIPCSVHALYYSTENESIIHYEDGSYLTITVYENNTARTSNTKSGSKSYIYSDANGTEMWRCVLNATFTYDGTTSKATLASAQFTSSDSNWYEDTLYTYRSGNTAYGKLTVGKKLLGVTVGTYNYTLTLTCDKDGNLS